MDHVDERIVHAAETCPQCGMRLAGGWEHRRVQVIELPAPSAVTITEHVLLRRRCPVCRRGVLPPVPGMAAGRIGRCRFGPRLLAEIATMATVERLPIRQIQQHLARRYRLHLSVGGIVSLLRQVAEHGEPTYRTLQADARASPVVNADETGWRQDGIPGFIWILSTPTLCLFHRDPHRSGDVIDDLLGEDFRGTLVTDFYVAYDVRPVLPERTSARISVGKASSGSPTMTTLFSMEVQYLPLMVNGGTAQPPR
jgi:transposase